METNSALKINEMEKTTLLLVDGYTLVRESLKLLLGTQKQYQVVGEASSAEEALEKAAKLNPDVVLLELSLPDKSGLEVIRAIRQKGDSTRVLVCSIYSDESVMKQAFAAGADGFAFKSENHQHLLKALSLVSGGQRFVADEFMHTLAEASSLKNGNRKSADPLGKLSKREREVFYHIAEGLPNREIAKKLYISPRTVETHRARVIRKLGVGNTAELIRYAIRNHLIAA